MQNLDEFFIKIKLNPEQSTAVREFIIDLLVDNLKLMKEEYNGEIDRAIKGLLEAK
ncbi:MAG: hypothetical protein Q8P53_02040 [Candidatus Shapirobacteria bacterium]|nr:hypothetical protein [Candidatus Shapirobacteria bacterium]